MINKKASFLLVGLGNPGMAYEWTRHNIGFLVVQALATKFGLSFKEDRRFQARIAKGVVNENNVHLMQPSTYMNRSGIAVRSYIDYFAIPLSHIIIIVDDVALPFAQMRLRAKGSAGGHNGLASIQKSLATPEYTRMRMGVGSPGERELADYVLDAFTFQERKELPLFIDRGVEILQRMLKENLSQVMTTVNAAP
jgi:PTH1 family peptidyl-tRNA hydrolase